MSDGRRRSGVLARGRTLLPVLVGLGVLVSLWFNCARTLSNTDTYFHLRFGHEFLHGWSLRHPGSVSTFATRPWVPTQWLSEIVMARTEDWFGLAGVAWLSGLLEVVLFVVLYAVSRRRADAWVAMSVTAVALLAMQRGLSMRPQVVSYVLVAVVTAAWLRTRDDGRVRWWLVPLVWAWAMLHGMWPVALAIGLAAAAGLVLDRAPGAVVVRSVAVTAACAVAAALTPVGPALYGAIVAVGHRTSYFAEWQTPDWTSWESLALGVLLVACAVGFGRRGRPSWTAVALVLLAGAFGGYSERTMAVAAAMLAPLTAEAVQRLVGRPTPPTTRERAVVGGAAAATLAALAVAVPFTSAGPPQQPSWVDPALSRLPPGTKVLDDWGYGGYLMWRFPQLDLMMHGYGDTFTTAELDRNEELLNLGTGWEVALRQSGARVAIVRPSRLSAALAMQEGWRLVHRSPDLEMLVAPPGYTSVPGVARPFTPDASAG